MGDTRNSVSDGELRVTFHRLLESIDEIEPEVFAEMVMRHPNKDNILKGLDIFGRTLEALAARLAGREGH